MTRRRDGVLLCPHCGQPRTDHDGAELLCCAAAWAQWHCHDCGETSIAFAFPYGRCPRCGGRLTLGQSSLDPGTDRAAVAAVRTAFEIELGGRAFYQRAAVEATDDAMRALFRRFAAMEGQHMEALARRHHITEIPPAPEVFGTELAALFAGVESRPDEPGNLFRIAIAAEHRAAGFFLRASSARSRGIGRPAPVPAAGGRGARSRADAEYRVQAVARTPGPPRRGARLRHRGARSGSVPQRRRTAARAGRSVAHRHRLRRRAARLP